MASSSIIKTQSGKSILSDHKDEKPPRQVFGRYLFEGELGVLYGDTNSGKSILANDIAFFVSGGGHNWPNMTSPHIPSMYIDMELTSKQFANRYKGADDYIPEDYIRAEVDVLNEEEDNLFPIIRDFVISKQTQPNPPRFIIVDNITNGFGSIWGSSQMRKLISNFKNLKDDYGLTILLVAHCPKRKKNKPIEQDDLGGSKMILNFVDSAFAVGTSFQTDDIRYIKQIKVRECEKEKKVMTVQIKDDPYLSFQYLDMTEEETHIDPKKMKMYYSFTPEEEMQLVDLLSRKNNGEKIYYSEISKQTGVPYDIVILYDIQNFQIPNNDK